MSHTSQVATVPSSAADMSWLRAGLNASLATGPVCTAASDTTAQERRSHSFTSCTQGGQGQGAISTGIPGAGGHQHRVARGRQGVMGH